MNRTYSKIKQSGRKNTSLPDSPFFDSFAYRQMMDHHLPDALKLFTRLAGFFPQSNIAFDSLGEIYLRMDQKDKAMDCLKKSLALNPDNENAMYLSFQ